MEEGIVTETRLEQLANAESPMDVTSYVIDPCSTVTGMIAEVMD